MKGVGGQSAIIIISIVSLCLFSIHCFPSVQIENSTTGEYVNMIYANNGSINQQFLILSSTFNCSINKLFTYSQNSTQLSNNTPYSIQVQNMLPPVSIDFSTVYNSINFTIVNQNCTNVNSSSPINCTYVVSNGCNPATWTFNYFDRVLVQINGYSIMTYNVLCNQNYLYSAFQFGNLIEVLYCTILLMIVPIYSRAWSIKGQGITVNLWIIIGAVLLVVIFGIIGLFAMQVLNYIATVLSWFVSIIGIGFCLNQTLFLTKNKYLLKGFILFKKVPCRFIQLISLLFGIGVTSAWYFLDKNWIINNIIFTCVTIFFIKVFKFTSLRISVFTFVIVIVIQFGAILLIFFLGEGSYNDVLLNQLNYPFQLQFPTINAMINQKCAWLPITSVIFPGMLFSYFRRFDTSRNTKLYLIIGIVVFIIGSTIWVVLSLVVPFSLPFGFVTEPAAMGLVAIFAYKRKQIRTLWYGRFYDQQFADMEGTKTLEQAIQFEKRESDLSSIRGSIVNGLKLNNRQDSSIQPIKFARINGGQFHPNMIDQSL